MDRETPVAPKDSGLNKAEIRTNLKQFFSAQEQSTQIQIASRQLEERNYKGAEVALQSMLVTLPKDGAQAKQVKALLAQLKEL